MFCFLECPQKFLQQFLFMFLSFINQVLGTFCQNYCLHTLFQLFPTLTRSKILYAERYLVFYSTSPSVQFSSSVMSHPLWPHESQHTMPPCPSLTPGVYSNSCPLSWWCHPTISSSVLPFSFHLQSFPASGSFQMSQLFTSGGQSIGASASVSVLLWIFRTDIL